eukprot:955089-Alexandrium_andersonii.AAC.1
MSASLVGSEMCIRDRRRRRTRFSRSRRVARGWPIRRRRTMPPSLRRLLRSMTQTAGPIGAGTEAGPAG